jgi:hypothetical protein
MKRHLCLCTRIFSLPLVTLFALLAFAPSEASAKIKTCYSDNEDRDHDGYARPAAAPIEKRVDSSDLRCPEGYVDHNTDCADWDAAIHPRTREIGYNYKDDNCNGLIDEPDFVYDRDGSNNTATSARLQVNFNFDTIRNAARAGVLYYTARVTPLHATGATFDIGPIRVVTADATFSSATLTVGALRPGIVYAIRLYFFRDRTVSIGPNADIPNDGLGRIDTELYYTMTDSPLEQIHNRFRLVMNALAEYKESRDGHVGYRGDENRDGTRYGASRNELWCSEFYSWAGHPYFRIGSISTVGNMKEYFADHDALYHTNQIPEADPGDYLSLDTDQNDDPNHSAMFLAYDAGIDKVWTLEGNHGNEVSVVKRPADWDDPLPAGARSKVINRLGHIRANMWR